MGRHGQERQDRCHSAHLQKSLKEHGRHDHKQFSPAEWKGDAQNFFQKRHAPGYDRRH
jgi:hypothetical protein